MKDNTKRAHRKQNSLRSSKGISKHEFKVKSNASYYPDRELFNDYDVDFLNKLSPEEFAWLSEFLASTIQGFKVDPEIVGEENAKIMNGVPLYDEDGVEIPNSNPNEWIRESCRGKNWRTRNDPYCLRNKVSLNDPYQNELEYGDVIPSVNPSALDLLLEAEEEGY